MMTIKGRTNANHDYNNFKNVGIWYNEGVAINSPLANHSGFLMVIANEYHDRIVQLCFDITARKIYMRGHIASGWEEWKSISLT